MMRVSKSSYCVRGIATSIFSVALALTQSVAVAQDAAETAEAAMTRGPQQPFKPSDGFIDATGPRYPFCPASLLAQNYETAPKQLFEGDTGWFFQSGEIDWSPLLSAGFFRDLTRMNNTLARQGTKLVVVVPPPRALLGYAHLPAQARNNGALQYGARLRSYLGMVTKLREAGPIVPDILGEARRNNVSFDRLTSPSDLHWSTTGAWVTALAVTRQITPDRLKSGVPPLMGTPAMVHGDSYTAILNKMCGTTWPGQAVRAFNLVETEDSGGGDLLGGSSGTDIVLVGTSFSALTHRYSFTPFIQAFSGMSIVNLAIAGGGPLTSLKQYTDSEDFRTDKPKYLVWEFTSSSLPDAGYANERGGILRAACPASVRSVKTTFKPGISPLVTADDIAKAGGGDTPLQLTLKSDNAAFKNFTVLMSYIDGRQDSIDIDTRRATTMDANYNFVLPDDHALISDIAVVNSDPLTGNISAQLCPATDPADPNTTAPTLFSRLAAWFKSFWS